MNGFPKEEHDDDEEALPGSDLDPGDAEDRGRLRPAPALAAGDENAPSLAEALPPAVALVPAGEPAAVSVGAALPFLGPLSLPGPVTSTVSISVSVSVSLVASPFFHVRVDIDANAFGLSSCRFWRPPEPLPLTFLLLKSWLFFAVLFFFLFFSLAELLASKPKMSSLAGVLSRPRPRARPDAGL